MNEGKLTDDQYRLKLIRKGTINHAGCFEWHGWRNYYNYGETSYRNKMWMVPRLAWHLWRGPIPEGIRVLHTCDNPACFNCNHLFLGTPYENTMDMVRKGRHHYSPSRKTHCRQGHEFTPENTYRAPSRPNKRACKECSRLRQRVGYRKYKGIGHE